MIDIKEIEKLAELSRLNMTDEEKIDFQKEIDSILTYVGQINNAGELSQTEEREMVRNIMRDDKDSHESGLFTNDLLAESPKQEDGYVRVKKIL